MDNRVHRAVFSLLIIALLLSIVASHPAFATDSSDVVSPSSTAPAADGITVITTQDALRESLETAELIAFAPNGSVLYYENSRDTYFDVDPVPNTSHTVIYVATEFISQEECSAPVACTRNQLVWTNLSTGESEVLYERVRLQQGDTRWHDIDRIDEHHYAVADLTEGNSVYIVNVTSELITWRWTAQSEFALDSGGGYGNTWTHLNDVEVLRDGRIMASARNQNRVVFINRSTGVVPEWTLGAEDDHDTLHRQHNPDFIPASEGGPAVLLADSENHRLVEYQRAEGGWERTWSFRDARLQWPRDADRLPDGHTLVTDSNGDRVFEIDRNGSVVWSVDVALPYEAERLSTPDESGDGPAAKRTGLPSVDRSIESTDGSGDRSVPEYIERGFRIVVPSLIINTLLFISPSWVSLLDWIAAIGIVGTAVVWVGVEAYLSNIRMETQWPVRFSRK